MPTYRKGSKAGKVAYAGGFGAGSKKRGRSRQSTGSFARKGRKKR